MKASNKHPQKKTAIDTRGEVKEGGRLGNFVISVELIGVLFVWLQISQTQKKKKSPSISFHLL